MLCPEAPRTWLDGGLAWEWVEHETQSRGLHLLQFTDGIAHVARVDGLFAVIWTRYGGEPPTEALVGPDLGLLMEAFIAGRDKLPGYDARAFAEGAAHERFRAALLWVLQWRPNPLGSLTSGGPL